MRVDGGGCADRRGCGAGVTYRGERGTLPRVVQYHVELLTLLMLSWSCSYGCVAAKTHWQIRSKSRLSKKTCCSWFSLDFRGVVAGCCLACFCCTRQHTTISDQKYVQYICTYVAHPQRRRLLPARRKAALGRAGVNRVIISSQQGVGCSHEKLSSLYHTVPHEMYHYRFGRHKFTESQTARSPGRA